MKLSPFSLFIKPGLLTLKQHSDRGAKRKKICKRRTEKKEKRIWGGWVMKRAAWQASTEDKLGGMKFLMSKKHKDFYLPLISQVLE